MIPKHAFIDYPCPESINELIRKKLIVMVHCGMDAIIGRYGTNVKTLKKLLKKFQGGK